MNSKYNSPAKQKHPTDSWKFWVLVVNTLIFCMDIIVRQVVEVPWKPEISVILALTSGIAAIVYRKSRMERVVYGFVILLTTNFSFAYVVLYFYMLIGMPMPWE